MAAAALQRHMYLTFVVWSQFWQENHLVKFGIKQHKPDTDLDVYEDAYL